MKALLSKSIYLALFVGLFVAFGFLTPNKAEAFYYGYGGTYCNINCGGYYYGGYGYSYGYSYGYNYGYSYGYGYPGYGYGYPTYYNYGYGYYSPGWYGGYHY
jgi:hypothetical protein